MRTHVWEMSVPFMLPLVSSYIPCHILLKGRRGEQLGYRNLVQSECIPFG